MSEAEKDRPTGIPWPPVLLAVVVGLALLLEHSLFRLPVPFAEVPMIHFLGMTLLLGGVVLLVWAALEFRRHQTSIRPDRGSHALLLAGPFAFSRNPIYLGEVIALIGAGIGFNRLWLILVAPLFALAVSRLAIQPEEAYLERRFGAAYLDYKVHVRRWI